MAVKRVLLAMTVADVGEIRAAYTERVIVRAQIRAARGLLGWSQRQLAEAAGVTLSAVKAFEAGGDPRMSVGAAIERAFTEAGILFLEPGDTRDGGAGLRFRQRN